MLRDISILKTVARASVRPAVFVTTANAVSNNVKYTNSFEKIMCGYGTIVISLITSSMAQSYIDGLLDDILIKEPSNEDEES